MTTELQRKGNKREGCSCWLEEGRGGRLLVKLDNWTADELRWGWHLAAGGSLGGVQVVAILK